MLSTRSVSRDMSVLDDSCMHKDCTLAWCPSKVKTGVEMLICHRRMARPRPQLASLNKTITHCKTVMISSEVLYHCCDWHQAMSLTPFLCALTDLHKMLHFFSEGRGCDLTDHFFSPRGTSVSTTEPSLLQLNKPCFGI